MSCLRSGRLSASCLATLLFTASASLAGVAAAAAPPLSKTVAGPNASDAAQMKLSGRALPLVFEENAGQLPQSTVFAGRTQDYTVQLRPSELRFGLQVKHGERTVSLSFTGSNGAKPEGVTDAGFRTNFYLGKDKAKWHTGVRNFDRVALRTLYPGIDAEFYARGNEIEHDFLLAPNADASQLMMHLAGAKSTTLSPAGDLLLAGEEGSLRLHKPVAYQVLADGTRQPVAAEFVLAKQSEGADLRFKLGAYDHTRALVIDPVISYATYVAGDVGSTPTAVTSDTAGNTYLTGYTQSSSASFNAAAVNKLATNAFDDPSPTYKVTFIARLSASDSGSKIAWLTYYGDNDASTGGDVVANAITLQPASFTPTGGTATAGTLLYIAGQTTATAIAGATNNTTLTTGNTFGFIANFKQADGTAGSSSAQYATYVDSGAATPSSVTVLRAVTVDSTGSVTAVGDATGTSYPTTSLPVGGLDPVLAGLLGVAGIPIPDTFCSSTGFTGTAYPKGLLTTMSTDLSTRTYSTYVCGRATGTATSFYHLTGVSVTPPPAGTTYATYVVAGSTNLDFPQSGTYNLPTLVAGPPPSLGTPTFFTPPAGATDAFAASLNPNTLNVNYSYFSNGTGVDNTTGLAADTSATPGTVIFGTTTSSNFVSASQTSPASAGTPTSYDAFYPAGETQAGFAVRLNSTGTLTALTFLAGGNAASTSGVAAGVTDAAGNVYLAGGTNDLKANFPQVSVFTGAVVTGSANRPATVALLPADEDKSVDSAPTVTTRGYVLRMPSTLDVVNYLAYFGPASATGSSQGVGVAVDTNSTGTNSGPNAYVLLNETPNAASSFTTASAIQLGPQVTDGTKSSAYLAQVAYATGATPALTVGAGTAVNPTLAGYGSSSVYTALTFTWQLTSPAASNGANTIVFNLPQSPVLQTYTAGNPPQITGSGSTPTCTLGTSAVMPTAAGFTCIVPSSAAGTTFQIVFTSNTAAGLNTTLDPITGMGTASVPAFAFDAQGDDVPLTQTFNTAGVPTLTLANTVSVGGTSYSPGPPAVVPTGNAAANATDYPNTLPGGVPSPTLNTVVSYTYTITNTGASYDSPNTKLTTNLPAGFTVVSTNSSTGCDPTTAATGCNVAKSSTLTYTVTGIYTASYLAANFSAGTTAGPYSLSAPAPTVTFTPQTQASSLTGQTTSLSLNGNTTVTLSAVTLTNNTYNTGFWLGQNNAQLNATVNNTGLNFATAYNETISLPKGFVPNASQCSGSSPAGSCTFTVSNIAAGQSANVNIVGRFQDTGTTNDAVAPPSTSATPTSATASGSTATGSTTSGPQTSGVQQPTGTYIAAVSTVPAATSITVTRINALSSGTTVSTPIASNTVNAFSRLSHPTPNTLNDLATYTVTVMNSGPSVARGVFLTIPVVPNTVPANAISVTAPSVAVSPSLDASTDTNLSCSYTYPNIVCFEQDLQAVPAPPGPSTTAPTSGTPQTYTITYTVGYDQSLIPTTAGTRNASVAGPQADTFFAAAGVASNPAATYKTATNGPAPGISITVQRSVNLTNLVSYRPLNASTPLTYLDKTRLNLDEHTANNVPGSNDTLVVTSSATNAGPNDADQVVISLPLEPYMLVPVPANCTLNIQDPGTGATTQSYTTPTTAPTLIATGPRATMVCSGASFANATPTGGSVTDTGQIRASASSSCAATLTPQAGTFANSGYDAGNTCFQVTFYAKYADTAAETDTVVGTGKFSAGISYASASLADNDVSGPPTSTASVSGSGPSITSVQRAAHVRLFTQVIPAPTYTDNTALPIDKSVTPNLPEVAQAAFRIDPTTNAVLATKVTNCFRTLVTVINDGPNYTATPVLNYGFTGGAYVSKATGSSAAASSPYVNCGGSTPAPPSNTAVALGTFAPKTVTATPHPVYLDGYFDTGSLGSVNSAPISFATGPFTFSDFQESNAAASDPAGATKDYLGTVAMTLANTPQNDASSVGFTVTSYGPAATFPQPQAVMYFNTVASAGITGVVTTSGLKTPNCPGTAGPAGATYDTCYPFGKSPLPSDAGAVRDLYQPGKTITYYQVPSTALVPTVSATSGSTTNPTTVCLTWISSLGSTLAFPDVFVKPERALLWLMANAPTGNTSFYNKFTNYTGAEFQTGDVTTSITPFGSASYAAQPAPTFPQVPQAQPGSVCGKINGLNNGTATAAGTSTTAGTAQAFALLEPVNFAPVVVAGAVPSSSSVSKGSTSALADVYLQPSVKTGSKVTSYQTYDYNDSDPCYVSGKRSICDDNPYLYAFVYDGGNGTAGPPTPKLVSSLGPETATNAPAGSLFLTANINLGSTTSAYVAVADQATGADSFNTAIGASNPYNHQGNFLTSTSATVCDPGQPISGYMVIGTPCKTVGTPTQEYVPGGTKDGTTTNLYILGNVGAESVTVTSGISGSGLIPLPYPDSSTPPTVSSNPYNPGGASCAPLGCDSSKNTTAAIASITAGQSAGFIWPWLSAQTNVPNGASANDQYTLGCFMVDASTQATQQPFPTGLTCSITTTTPTNPSASPTVYTFGKSTAPTIFVTTNGNLFAGNAAPGWKHAMEGLALAMLLPVLVFRKRLGKGAALAMVLLAVTAAPLLSGCGSTTNGGGGSGGGGSTGPITPAGTYYFRVTATPPSGSVAKGVVTSAPFVVVVK